MKNTIEMSDIGRALASKEGPIISKKLSDLLNMQIAQLENQARRGLDKAGFEANKEHIKAIRSASLILQSIELFHSVR